MQKIFARDSSLLHGKLDGWAIVFLLFFAFIYSNSVTPDTWLYAGSCFHAHFIVIYRQRLQHAIRMLISAEEFLNQKHTHTQKRLSFVVTDSVRCRFIITVFSRSCGNLLNIVAASAVQCASQNESREGNTWWSPARIRMFMPWNCIPSLFLFFFLNRNNTCFHIVASQSFRRIQLIHLHRWEPL